MEFAKRLGRRIRQLRMEKGLTPAEVAWESDPGLSRFHLSNIERGRKVPSLSVLFGIGERLGVAAFELLVFPRTEPLAEVAELARQLPPERLAALATALRKEIGTP